MPNNDLRDQLKFAETILLEENLLLEGSYVWNEPLRAEREQWTWVKLLAENVSAKVEKCPWYLASLYLLDFSISMKKPVLKSRKWVLVGCDYFQQLKIDT